MSELLDEIKTDVPDQVDFRKFVDQKVKKKRDQVLIKTLYLLAARASEVCTRTTEWDLQNKRSRPYGKVLSLELFRKTDIKNKWVEDLALFRVGTAKRSKEKVLFKIIALPCNPVYEPWTIDLLTWHLRHQRQSSFDHTRFWVWRVIKESLSDLDPEVHPHSLRHWRLTHLADEYQFDDFELTLYAGWTLATGTRGSRQLDTYVHLNWSRYLPKLLVPCRYRTKLAEEWLKKQRERKKEVERVTELERQQSQGVI